MHTPTSPTPRDIGPNAHRRHGWRRATAATIAGLVLVAAPGSVSATSVRQSVSTSHAASAQNDDLRPRVERACLRIPNLQIRTDHLLERLRSDAETIGSLAWLEVQIERARNRGLDDLVQVLENRLAVRTASVAVLEQRADELGRLAELCIEYGVEL